MTEYCIRHDTLMAASLLTGAVITSPPEFNGHVVTWSEVRP